MPKVHNKQYYLDLCEIRHSDKLAEWCCDGFEAWMYQEETEPPKDYGVVYKGTQLESISNPVEIPAVIQYKHAKRMWQCGNNIARGIENVE